MMRTLRHFTILLLLTTLISSCTSVLVINAKEAPVVMAEPGQRILVVRHFNQSLVPKEKDNLREVLQSGSKQAIEGLKQKFEGDTSYSLVIADSTVYTPAPGRESLTPEMASMLCLKHGTDLLLSLDNFDLTLEQEVVREPTFEGFIASSTYHVLQAESYWTLFDELGNILDYVIVPSSTPFDSRGLLRGNISITKDIVHKLSQESGQMYAQRFFPQSIPIYRPFYLLRGNMSLATDYMEIGRWNEAIELLLPEASVESPKRRHIKAAYNLALAYEAAGKIDEAEKWARHALDRNDNLARELLADLQNYN